MSESSCRLTTQDLTGPFHTERYPDRSNVIDGQKGVAEVLVAAHAAHDLVQGHAADATVDVIESTFAYLVFPEILGSLKEIRLNLLEQGGQFFLDGLGFNEFFIPVDPVDQYDLILIDILGTDFNSHRYPPHLPL